jgi:hypothetical protein
MVSSIGGLSMKKDLIIGSFTNYDWDKIKFWANSIDHSGFTGDKAMIVYNAGFDTVQKLVDRNFMIFAFNRDDAKQQFFFPAQQLIIVVQRFMDLYRFMSNMDLSKYRYVIHTDVKDVVFQSNPSDWLSENMGDAKILASSESIRYQDEPWGNENMARSFPLVYDGIKTQPIWNCGVQAGIPETMKDLWLNIFLISIGSQAATGIYNPDQAAYNVLLNTMLYKDVTRFSMSEDGWACQAGTTIDPAKIAAFKPHLLEAQPIWQDGYARTTNGKVFPILHQYDRIPDWKDVVEKRYA